MEFNYDYCKVSADYIRSKINFEPELGMILGSGLSPLAAEIEDALEIPYSEIPNFLLSTVATHAGKLICGRLAGKNVVCMSGRFHSYEGYDFRQMSIPVHVYKVLGVRAMILTNAAAAVNMPYKPGDIMIIRDHMMFSGMSPMRGANDERFGPRFFDVSKMYSPQLIQTAQECASGTDLTVHQGVYFFMQGPQFETPSEIRAIRLLGGDAVGMSTVTEALTAAHCSLPVLGFSVLTNMAAGITDKPLSDEEVNEVGNMIADQFSDYIRTVIEKI